MMATQTQYFMKNDTNFLRFVAIALIINSHLEDYYPIRYFGTGGCMGNSLFLVLSSFGLFLSGKKNPKPFTEWYTQRIKRIYPTVWIVLIVLTLPYKIYMNAFDVNNILLFFGHFFYPPFWFLQALMVFYVPIYFIIKHYNVKNIVYLVFALCLLYAFIYLNFLDLSQWCIQEDPIVLVFYLIIFIFGTFLAHCDDSIRYSGLHDWGLLFLSVVVIYGHKVLMLKGIASSFQFIQQLFIFPFIYYCVKVSRSGIIQNRIMQLPALKFTINYISSLTLELYIVHLYVIIVIPQLKLPFPINIIAVLIVSLIITQSIKCLSNYIFVSSAHLPRK